MLKRLKIRTYVVFKDNGKQKHINDVIQYLISVIIILNVIFIIVGSVDEIALKHQKLFAILNEVFFMFFVIEYLVRIWIADFSYHMLHHPWKARLRFIFSFVGIIDFLALLPRILGGTIIDFRIFRVLRLFRITQITGLQEYNLLIAKVLKAKGRQLLSSMVVVFIFLLASAVIIYDLEHKVQPDVFTNVLVGLWWACSTISTVGYGDTYPVTALGRALGAFISMSGLFVMAIPIGILSAGFFDVSKGDPEITEKKENQQ